MKKVLIGMACALAVALVVVVGVQKAAYADGAIVIHNDGLCGMPGSDADGNITFGGIGQVTHDVKNGNKEIMTCKGSDLTNLSGRGQHYEDFPCGTLYGITTDTHATVSANGNGSLTCVVTF